MQNVGGLPSSLEETPSAKEDSRIDRDSASSQAFCTELLLQGILQLSGLRASGVQGLAGALSAGPRLRECPWWLLGFQNVSVSKTALGVSGGLQAFRVAGPSRNSGLRVCCFSPVGLAVRSNTTLYSVDVFVK